MRNVFSAFLIVVLARQCQSELQSPIDWGKELPSRVVFICNARGSMLGLFEDGVQTELNKQIDGLKESQSFGIVIYQAGRAMEFDGTLKPARQENKKKAHAFLKAVVPRGYGGEAEGFSAVIRMNPQAVLWFTNDAIDWVAIAPALRKAMEKKVRIDVGEIDRSDDDIAMKLKQTAMTSGGVYRGMHAQPSKGDRAGPASKPTTRSKPASEPKIMLLLDARGSMMNKFDTAKIAVRNRTAQWTKKDHFNVVCFGGAGLKTLQGSGFSPATDLVKANALILIDGVAPQGSSGAVASLRWVIEQEPTSILFCTDGRMSDGEEFLALLKRWMAINPDLQLNIISMEEMNDKNDSIVRKLVEDTGAKVLKP